MRSDAASRAAVSASPVFCRISSALVISRTAFAIETPTDMMMPMYDWRLSVEPQSKRSVSEPTRTAGAVVSTASDSLNDWKFAASMRKMTTRAMRSPDCKPSSVPSSVSVRPLTSTVSPRGGGPSARIAAPTCALADPRSSPCTFAVIVSIGIAPRLSVWP